uniref:SSD domain-containing protein n=1 Tax=Ditylenchus dipsaci TaxID=166011 RepID=A0A915DXN3_9BILA
MTYNLRKRTAALDCRVYEASVKKMRPSNASSESKVKIFEYLDVATRMSIEGVCRRWMQISSALSWSTTSKLVVRNMLNTFVREPYLKSMQYKKHCRAYMKEIGNRKLSSLMIRCGKYVTDVDFSKLEDYIDFANCWHIVLKRIPCNQLHHLNISGIGILPHELNGLATRFSTLKSAIFKECFSRDLGISTSIDHFLSLCSVLETLDLYENDITGSTFTELPASLKSLSLNYCRGITNFNLAQIPVRCPQIESLTVCDTDEDRNISAETLNALFQLKNLRKLVIKGDFDVQLNQPFNLPNLNHLEITFDEFLSDIFLQSVGQCCQLKTLFLFDTAPNQDDHYSSSELLQLANLKQLEALSLVGSWSLSDETIKAIAKCNPCLKMLNVSFSLLTDESMMFVIDNCRCLQSLVVANCERVTMKTADKIMSHLDRIHGENLPEKSDQLFQICCCNTGITELKLKDMSSPWLNVKHCNAIDISLLLSLPEIMSKRSPAPASLFLSGSAAKYSQILFTHPTLVLLLTVVVFGLLPSAILVAFPLQLDSNPEKGFDTRGTPYAGPRLAWAKLQPWMLQGSRVIADINNRTKRSWADDLISSFSSVACYDQPIPAMSYLSQFVITIPEYEQLYSNKFLTELCNLQKELAPNLHLFDQITPYRSIYHVANFFACLAPESRVNCSYLTEGDLSRIRLAVEQCIPHRKAILECRRYCQPHHQLPTVPSTNTCGHPCDAALNIPSNCTSQMMFDLFYRIFPKDLMATPFHLNAFLPFYTYSSYRLQGYDVDISMYTRLQEQLRKSADKSETYELKGILMDVKRDILLEAAISDSRFSLIAGVCVFLLIAVYSLSGSYSLAVLWQLGCSVCSSLAVYRLFNAEFPLLNLIVFVLLISIGSDGAFLLLNAFPKAEKLNVASFYDCLSHTAATMFLTQFSTVVPFFLNIFSSVIAFRSFGMFAGLTLIINYLLLISFLPAFLIFQHKYVNPWLARILPSSFWYCFPSLSGVSVGDSPRIIPVNSHTPASPRVSELSAFEQFCDFFRSLLYDVLPVVLIQGRFVWICSLSVALVFSIFICITQLRLPQYNPLQLFVASNLHEYYDNNAEKLFDFVESKIAETVCCNTGSAFYADSFLDYCMRLSTAQLSTQYNDTPIYHNTTFELIGYTALLPTLLNTHIDFPIYQILFNSLIKTYKVEMQVLNVNLVRPTTLHNFGLCYLESEVHLCYGWEIGVLEGVILVLVVGLSFDYTLHYGASVPDKGCAMHRIQTSVQKATVPVTMAAFSSILAGSIMLLAQTHAFFQVAVFLVVSTSMSFLFATFFFLPLLYIFLPSQNEYCKKCDKTQRSLLQLRDMQVKANTLART